MGLRIGTNVASVAAQRLLSKSESRTTHAMRALASGSRIVNAGDDAAGFAISESLRGQVASLSQAKNNADNARGFIQVAEGGLNEQNNILIRVRELAVQSASDTVSDDEREFLETEVRQLVQEFDRIAQTTTYGQKQLLVGSNQEFEFHLGTDNKEVDIIKYKMEADTRSETLGVDEVTIADQDDARDALAEIDAKKDEKKKDDKKKKKKKKKIDGKEENKDTEQTNDDDSDESDESADAGSPAAADAGFAGGVIAAEPNAYPVTLKEWQDYLLGTPDYKRTTEFIRLHQTGIVESEIFYTIVDQMLDDTRYRMRELGVMSLGATPSVRSFSVLVEVHNTETTSVKDYAARHIRAYSQLQYLRILVSTLSSDGVNPTLSLEALRLLQQASQRYLKNLNTGQPSEQGTDDRTPASSVVRHFDAFVPVLTQMSHAASNSDIRHYATQALSELQALLQPHTT